MLREVKRMSERFACRVVGLHRSIYRRLPVKDTPIDPDAGLLACCGRMPPETRVMGSGAPGRGCGSTRAVM
jgi:hypothetical protein